MTLAQIKLEALMLMYPEMRLPVDSELAEERITQLSQGSLYCDLINSMDQSISRALFYIELWELTKIKRQVVAPIRQEFGEYFLPVPKDAFAITNVQIRGYEGMEPVQYVVIDEEICTLEKSNEYIIEYREREVRPNGQTPLSTKLNLAQEIEIIIPYFIKGELYKESQKEASLCLERFFTSLEKLSSMAKSRTECRISPYKMT